MRRLILVELIFVTLPVSCVHSQVTQPDSVTQTYLDHQEEIRKQEEAKAAAEKEEKEQQERAAKERREIQENKRIDAAYSDFLKTNKCETKHWSRYEFGEYFQGIADKNKITPYDVAWGDAYKTRNISRSLKEEARNNYFNYSMPKPIEDKMLQNFPDEKAKSENHKAVFNASIKRDYECYKKLK